MVDKFRKRTLMGFSLNPCRKPHRKTLNKALKSAKHQITQIIRRSRGIPLIHTSKSSVNRNIESVRRIGHLNILRIRSA